VYKADTLPFPGQRRAYWTLVIRSHVSTVGASSFK